MPSTRSRVQYTFPCPIHSRDFGATQRFVSASTLRLSCRCLGEAVEASLVIGLAFSLARLSLRDDLLFRFATSGVAKRPRCSGFVFTTLRGLCCCAPPPYAGSRPSIRPSSLDTNGIHVPCNVFRLFGEGLVTLERSCWRAVAKGL